LLLATDAVAKAGQQLQPDHLSLADAVSALLG